jgi:hypothetical protein
MAKLVIISKAMQESNDGLQTDVRGTSPKSRVPTNTVCEDTNSPKCFLGLSTQALSQPLFR